MQYLNNIKQIADKTNSKYIGDLTSGVYSSTYKCTDAFSFVIFTENETLHVQFNIGENEYISKEILSSQIDDDVEQNYDFIYNDYWYSVVNNGNNAEVVCSKYNKDNMVDETIYTLNKNDKWSTEHKKYPFDFDENNTINIYYSDTEYSHAWWYINTKSQVIEERDKSTQKVLHTLIPIHENSVSAAKKAIALSLKPYQYINGYASATSSWSDGKITIKLGGYRNLQLRWAVEKGVSIESAELVIAIDKKEVFTEPMTIEDIRNENPNNHIWDYLAYTKKNTYVMDCKNKESTCEVYAKCIDDKGAEYHVYLTPTEFNTDSEKIAYTYIMYNGYGFWY